MGPLPAEPIDPGAARAATAYSRLPYRSRLSCESRPMRSVICCQVVGRLVERLLGRHLPAIAADRFLSRLSQYSNVPGMRR